MTVNKFIADTSSLILLNKSKLLRIFATNFLIITTKSVINEFNKGNRLNINENLFIIEPNNCVADNDILNIFTNSENAALLTDDLKLLKVALKSNLNYLSALVIPYILFYYQIINQNQLYYFVSKIKNIGFYSEKVIKTAENFEKKLPGWMKEINFKNQITC